jgi:actin related protein 2/3 complex subunit 2
MILLETVNVIVRNLITEWFTDGRALDITCADFDGAQFKLFSQANTSTLTVSLKSPAADSLLKQGGKDYLSNVYGGLIVNAVSGYDVSIQIPFSTADKPTVAQKTASLKSYLYSSLVLVRMEAANKGQTIPGMLDVALRSQKERMWVKQDGTDRITVIFSIEFQAHNDSVLGQVFCNEFATVKESGTPSVSYSVKPPSELKDVKNIPTGDRISFLTFVVYDRHWKGAKLENAAFTITSFRNYLHYHLKCCKSYLHTRMRTRVENLLKVLNRAKQQDNSGPKKTAGGRNFTRSVK